jgi:hypothetical protein
LVLAFVIALIASSLPKSEEQKEYELKTEAWILAQKCITSQVLWPSIASFGGFEQRPENVTKIANQFHVRGWGRAENQLGLKLRKKSRCVLEYNGGNWALVDLGIKNNPYGIQGHTWPLSRMLK